MSATQLEDAGSETANIKERAVNQRKAHPNSEVPEYAHRLDEEFSIPTASDTRSFLHAYFRAGWDDRHHEGEPYWLGEATRCYTRYDTVWRVKTVEEVADLIYRLKFRASAGTRGVIGFDEQNRKACQRMLKEIVENVDREELEEKLENTEYGDIMKVFEE